MTTIRIGNDIHVRWSVFSRNGAPYVLDGAVIRLWLLSGPFRKRITDFSVSENMVSFLVDAKDLHRYGIYKLVLSLTDSASQTEDTAFDFTEVFQIVSKTYSGSSDAVLDGNVVVTPSSIIDNVVENYVTNAADGEDLTTVNNLLKFRDRPAGDGAKGYVILRQNKTFAEQVTEEDTIYEIRYNFDLGDESVTIPSGCVLKFNGGMVVDGTLVGDGTEIEYRGPVFSGITIGGTWNVPEINSKMFADCTDTDVLKSLFALQNADIYNRIVVEKESSDYSVALPASGDTAIYVRSNTDVVIDGTIALQANGSPSYHIIRLNGNNIKISGSGAIVGDKDEHDYTGHTDPGQATHEWGMGIRIDHTCRNIVIEGLEVRDCTGDAIYQRSTYDESTETEKQPEDIVIRNVVLHDCRRQGITLMGLDNCLVENFRIYNITGTGPGAGIDIEPNGKEGPSTTTGLTIRNGSIDHVLVGIQSARQRDSETSIEYSWTVFKDIVISNVTVTDCAGTGINLYRYEKADVSNCDITNYGYGFNLSYCLANLRNCFVNTSVNSSGKGCAVFNIGGRISLSCCNLTGYTAFRTLHGLSVDACTITTSSNLLQETSTTTVIGSIRHSIINCTGFIQNNGPVSLKNNVISCKYVIVSAFSVIEQNTFTGTASSTTTNFLSGSNNTVRMIVKDNIIEVPDGVYKYVIHVVQNTNSVVYGNIISGNNYSGEDAGRFIGERQGNYITNFSGYPSFGPFNAKPVFDTNNVLDDSIIGFCYYDTDNNRPIWHKGNNVWADATGATV